MVIIVSLPSPGSPRGRPGAGWVVGGAGRARGGGGRGGAERAWRRGGGVPAWVHEGRRRVLGEAGCSVAAGRPSGPPPGGGAAASPAPARPGGRGEGVRPTA